MTSTPVVDSAAFISRRTLVARRFARNKLAVAALAVIKVSRRAHG